MVSIIHPLAKKGLTDAHRLANSHDATDDLTLIRTLKGGSHASTRVFATREGTCFVRKTALTPYASKLRHQCAWLRERQGAAHIPTILHEMHDANGYSYDLEYLESYQPFYDVIHTQPIAESCAILHNVLNVIDQQIHGTKVTRHAPDIARRYIAEKIIEKVRTVARMLPQLQALLAYDTINVNGVRYPNLPILTAQLLNDEGIVRTLSTIEECAIHGDLTIDNIVVKGNNVVLLDPNDENAISDPLVDFAKLYQSLHSGYEFLCRLDSVTVNNNAISFDETMSMQYRALFDDLDTQLAHRMTPVRRGILRFHESVHYCRMLPYRAAIQPHIVPALYGVAVRLMAQFIAQPSVPLACRMTDTP